MPRRRRGFLAALGFGLYFLTRYSRGISEKKKKKKRGERRGGGVISRDCTFCVRASFVQNERARLRYEPVAPLALL